VNWTRVPYIPVVPAEWRKARTEPRVFVQPVAKAGDIIEVHVPPIGTWRVDELIEDFRGRRYLRVSRRTGGSTEFRIIANAGFEILNQIEAD
jgi:hypothetical protein